MGCYVALLAAAIMHYIIRNNSSSLKHDRYHTWLNLLFGGAAIFGLVDHLWNRELLVFTVPDIMLGLMITLTITVCWAAITWLDRRTAKETARHKA